MRDKERDSLAQHGSYELYRYPLHKEGVEINGVRNPPSSPQSSSILRVLTDLHEAVAERSLEIGRAIVLQSLQDKGIRIVHTPTTTATVATDTTETMKVIKRVRLQQVPPSVNELSNTWLVDDLLKRYGDESLPCISFPLLARLRMIDQRTPDMMLRVHLAVCVAFDQPVAKAGAALTSLNTLDKKTLGELPNMQKCAVILYNLARIVQQPSPSNSHDSSNALFVRNGTQWHSKKLVTNGVGEEKWLLDPMATTTSPLLSTQAFFGRLSEFGVKLWKPILQHNSDSADEKMCHAMTMTPKDVFSLFRSLVNSYFDVDYIVTPTRGTKVPTAQTRSLVQLLHIYAAWASDKKLLPLFPVEFCQQVLDKNINEWEKVDDDDSLYDEDDAKDAKLVQRALVKHTHLAHRAAKLNLATREKEKLL